MQVPDCYGNKVKGVEINGVEIIFDNGSKIGPEKLVVFNIMDDDVKVNYNVSSTDVYYNQPVVCMKSFLQYRGNLQYVYLRLDTIAIMNSAFTGNTNLKYINIESLTELREIGDGNNFKGCTSLFDDYVLDLSKTNLATIDNGSSFASVPLKGVILPNTITNISAQTFQNCTKLETVTMMKKSDKTTTIGKSLFDGCTSLKAIYYVGTESDFGTLKIDETGNDQLKSTISFAAYNALSDEEKAKNTYAVYDYSWCLGYNNGVHGTINTTTNICVGKCEDCKMNIVNHVNGNTVTTITYISYTSVGTKAIDCKNEGCTYSVTLEAPALFTCLGYSASTFGDKGIDIGYTVNNEAIDEYTSVSGNTLEYGVFAVSKNKLGKNDVFANDGTVTEGVISANLSNQLFEAFSVKITGITDENMDASLALGAYVIVTDGETTKYSYIQTKSPSEGEKYYFASYNDIVS